MNVRFTQASSILVHTIHKKGIVNTSVLNFKYISNNFNSMCVPITLKELFYKCDLKIATKYFNYDIIICYICLAL